MAKRAGSRGDDNKALAIGMMILGGLWLWGKRREDGSGGQSGATVPSTSDIEAITSRSDLEAARTSFESAYRSGAISRSEYDALYLAYLRRSYWIDLYSRGGKWVTAAAEYWTATAGIADANAIYAAYQQVYARYVETSGGTTTPPTPTTATIVGSIRDTNGKPISGATIRLGPYSTTSDAAGNFLIASIAPGTYSLIITKSGYNDYPAGDVRLNAGDVRPFSIIMTSYTQPEPYTGTVTQQLASIWQYLGDGNGTARKLVWAYRGSKWLLYDSTPGAPSDLLAIEPGDRLSLWVDAACTLTLFSKTWPLQQGWNTVFV